MKIQFDTVDTEDKCVGLNLSVQEFMILFALLGRSNTANVSNCLVGSGVRVRMSNSTISEITSPLYQKLKEIVLVIQGES